MFLKHLKLEIQTIYALNINSLMNWYLSNYLKDFHFIWKMNMNKRLESKSLNILN